MSGSERKPSKFDSKSGKRIIDNGFHQKVNRKTKKTRIAGYCANSTECPDNSLKKIFKKFKRPEV